MLRRTMTAVLAIALIAFAGTSMAQSVSVLGVYTSPAGGPSSSVHVPVLFASFDVFVVLHAESTVTGVAYTISWPAHIIGNAVGYGPSGGGLNVPNGGGNNVGLGECAIGFNNQPVLIAQYSAITVNLAGPSGITLGPNTSENPFLPVFADCADNLLVCDAVQALQLDGVIGTEESSFGAVKSLYGN